MFSLDEAWQQSSKLEGYDEGIKINISESEGLLAGTVFTYIQVSRDIISFIREWLKPENPNGVIVIALLVIYYIVVRDSILIAKDQAESLTDAVSKATESNCASIRYWAVTILSFLYSIDRLHDPKAIAIKLEVMRRNEQEKEVQKVMANLVGILPRTGSKLL